MPRWADYAVRKNIPLRTQYYGQLWAAHLKERESPEENSQLNADTAFKLLKGIDASLAKAERDYQTGVAKPEAFAFILNKNPQTFLRGIDLARGFEQLAQGKDSRSTLLHNKVIPSAFDHIENFWLYEHHLKTLGTLLAMVIENYPEDQVEHPARGLGRPRRPLREAVSQNSEQPVGSS